MNKCFECEATEDLQEHHPVPRSRGGTKTVTLCYECHMKAHGRDSKGMNHGRLTEEGLQQAKRNGVKFGTHIPSVLEARYITGNKTLQRIFPYIQLAKSEGRTTRRELAEFLNSNDILTPRGKTWNKNSITSTLNRIRLAVADGRLDPQMQKAKSGGYITRKENITYHLRRINKIKED